MPSVAIESFAVGTAERLPQDLMTNCPSPIWISHRELICHEYAANASLLARCVTTTRRQASGETQDRSQSEHRNVRIPAPSERVQGRKS